MNLFPFLLILMAIGLYANNIPDTLHSDSQKWFHNGAKITGEFECSTLKLTVNKGDTYLYKPLIYQSEIDSSDVTLSTGDVFVDEESGVSISLAWTVADGNLKNLAGFEIYQKPSSSSQKKRTLLNSATKFQQPESIIYYNIIGKRLSENMVRKLSVISKQHDRKVLMIW